MTRRYIHMTRKDLSGEGWVDAYPTYTLTRLLDPTLRAEISRARQLAHREDRDLKMVTKFRPDLIPHQAARYGHARPDFFLNSVKLKDTIDEWTSKGYQIRLSPKVSTRNWTTLAQMAETPCQLYFHLSDKTAYVTSFVADVTNEEYQQLSIKHAVETVEYYGLDGLWLDCKVDWHGHGSPARSKPSFHPERGGVLFPSPHGEGEFEAGYATIIDGIAAAGVNIITVTRPGTPFEWAPKSTQENIFAEYE